MTLATHSQLSEAVERERRRATVRSLDMSFNELADMYRTGELHITPSYQRTFRWSAAKQSQFVESMILEMPVPPIYAVEIREGKWELIDGLQRLSTYLHLRSELTIEDPNDLGTKLFEAGEDKLTLENCDIVPELNGYHFEDLTTSLQYRIRRSTLRLELVRQESNPHFAFHMFKRLNTGGEPLSNQEARNCSIRLLGTKFTDFIHDCIACVPFNVCIEDVTDEFRSRMGDGELVLRFFAFKNNLDEYVHDIDPFLTNFMERVTDDRIPFDFRHEKAVFERTFAVLSKTLAEKTGRRWTRNAFQGGFSVNHYEAFAIGVSRTIDQFDDEDSDVIARLTEALEEVKKNEELRKLTTGGGKNFRRLYEQKIGIVEAAIRAVI